MLSRRNEILNAGVFAPRAHLDGLTLPSGFQLPPLEAVVSDVDMRSYFFHRGIASTLINAILQQCRSCRQKEAPAISTFA